MQADSLELKTNVLAAYVAAGLSKQIPALMSAMKLSADKSFEVHTRAHTHRHKHLQLHFSTQGRKRQRLMCSATKGE